MYINKYEDIGYIVKGNNMLPIKPMVVEQKRVISKKYKEKNNTKLLIHHEILKYYIATDIIKNAEHILINGYERFDLIEALTDMGFSVIIRSNHLLSILLPDHLSRSEYDNINTITDSLKETVNEIAHSHTDETGNRNIETFNDMKEAVITLNKRYKSNKEGGKTR